MKKLLLIAPAVLLIAAGCNSNPQQNSTGYDATQSQPQAQQQSSSGSSSSQASSIPPTSNVDNFVNTLNAQAQSSANAASTSNTDLMNSDSSTLNSYGNVQ